LALIDQESIDKTSLGKDSNAIVWPRGPPDEEDDEEGPENFKNQRYMRIGVFIFMNLGQKKFAD
jgi:translation initiation factor eIF-2B subunit epsilon